MKRPIQNSAGKLLLVATFFFALGNLSAQSWNQRGSDIDGEASGDNSGRSIALSSDGNTLAIGANRNDGSGSDAGHVRVYTWNSGTSAWVQRGSDIDGEASGDNSGRSIALSSDGNTLAIGANKNDGSGSDAGHVRVYTWNGSAWVQQGADIDGETADDLSGWSVSMPDANTVAIGAPGNGGNGSSAGHVRVYVWNGSAWVQKGADIDGEAAGDESGWSVSMPNANTVAIGSQFNDGSGTDAGHVRVYTWNGSAWVQRGSDIDGEAGGDQAGWSVSMPDANTLAIGAILNDGTASNAGHVRVFTFSGGSAPTCATGTVTWDGGGSDERFFTKENWVGDLCPCASADLVFNGSGSNTKHCILDSSLTLGTITLNNAYKGRFRVEKSGVVLTADSVVTSGPGVVLNPETGAAVIGLVHVSNNAMVNVACNAGINVTNLKVGLAGYIGFRSKSNINITNLSVDQYSQFRGPQNGNIYITGNLFIDSRNTVDGNGATLHFTGTGNQEVEVSSANQIKTIPMVVNKSSGAVVLKKDLNADKLTLTSGNINTGSNKMGLTATGGLFGGSSSSYINGKVGIDHSSAWPGSKMRLPMGKGSKYRPITLHNTSSTNTWEVEFIDSDPNSLGSANAPLSDISADGYWSANRTAGGGGLLADATYFEISDAGKGAWNNGDLRVAHYDGSTGWDDRGGSFTSNAVISIDNTLRGNAGYRVALGQEGAIPAPIMVDPVAAANTALQFSLYPNPVVATLHIALSGADKGSITLSDLSGKVLGIYSADTRSIDMSRFAAGVYFATFSNGEQRITHRVIRN
jgi:hypothetical protein